MNILFVLLLAHFISDFYLQPTKWAMNKDKEFKFMAKHCALYALILGLSIFICISFQKAIWAFLMIAVSHFIVDILKSQINKRIKNSGKENILSFHVFWIDQVIHITMIVVVFFALNLSACQSDLFIYLEQEFENMHKVLSYALLLILIWDPAAIFVKKLLACITPATSETVESTCQNEEDTQNDSISAGRLIGEIERFIIALLMIHDELGALGFVLAAKSLARYKQFEDINFTEKFLVGTLTSTVIAILCTTLLT